MKKQEQLLKHEYQRHTRAGNRRIDLDFVRGIAILLAMGWHFNHTDSGWIVVDLLQYPGRTFGWAGVDIFFVLSGFLVGGLIFEEHLGTGQFDARRFLIRRAFKIWPVMYLYVALVIATGRSHWEEVLPQTLFHVQNYFPTPLSHLWSLAVEEHFYLIAAFLFGCLVATQDSHKISVTPIVLIGLMAIAPVLRATGVLAGIDARSLQWQTQYRIDALACGVLLAYWRIWKPDLFQMLVRQRVVCATIVGLGIAYLVSPKSSLINIGVVGYTITYLSGAALLLLVYDNPMANGNLASRALAWIGSYSYPMYVFQFVMVRICERLWAQFSTNSIPPLLELGFSYIGAVLLAVCISRLVETPALNLRNKLFPSQRMGLKKSTG